jgi:hypothetical protein
MKKNITLLLLTLLVIVTSAIGQDDEALKSRLAGRTKLGDIMASVKEYYEDPAVQQRLGLSIVKRKLKKWKRWEWYMSSRTGEQGELVNISEKLLAPSAQRNITSRIGEPPLTESTPGNWTLVGPVTTPSGIGRADRMAFHPTDPNTIYAGTSGGGLWKTTNGGASWFCLTNDLPSLGVSGVVVQPNNPNIIYILTGDGDSDFGGLVEQFGYMHTSVGVLKSIDGGLTWQPTGTFPGNISGLNGFQLIQHPSSFNTLLAATNRGLFKTTNGGATWIEVIDENTYDVVYKPGDPTFVYAVTYTSGTPHFYRSINSGDNFSGTGGTDALIANGNRCKLAVSPASPTVVYLLAGGSPGDSLFTGLFRSTASGSNFSLMSNFPNILGGSSIGSDDKDQAGYDLAMAVHPQVSTYLLTGAVRIWRNGTGGAPFTWIYAGGTHADVHELQYNPLDNKLWAATDGGPYYSTDNGVTWVAAYNFLAVTQFYHLAVRPDDYLQMLGGTQDNGMKYRSANSAFFEDISGSDGYFGGFDAANNSIFYSILNSDVAKFTNNGANVETISPPGDQLTEFFPSMAVHTGTGNTLWIGSDSIWKTTNGGTTWTATDSIPAGWFFKSCQSNGNRLYVAGGWSANGTSIKSLRRSDDGGSTWPAANILHDNPGFPANFPKITCINTDPTSSARVWVTFGGFTDGLKVYYSDNFGASWVNRSGSLPNVPVNTIAIDNNNNAYAGTDNGVFYRGANMTDWVPFYNNLPYAPVTTLVISEAENRIRAATFGRGVWQSDLYSTCPPSLNITGTLEGQEFYEASGTVSSTATLQNSVGTKVVMRSATEVRLTPGFTAPANTKLKAGIGPCGSGQFNDFRTAGGELRFDVKRMLKPKTTAASIEVLSVSPNNSKAKLHINTPGAIEVIVSAEDGTVLATLPVKNYSERTSRELQLSLPGLSKGMYYVHVVHNQEWVHFQEIEVR